MAEEALKQEVQEQEQEQAKEQPKEPAKPSFSLEDRERIQEDKARQSGWKPLDEYLAEGGDPTNWKTAGEFNIFGEMLSTIRNNKRDFEHRLEGVQKLTQAQLAAQREQLLSKRDEAIEAGQVKDVHRLDKQIQALDVQPVHPQVHAALDNWNAENPWIFEESPKSAYARQVFAREISMGKPVEAAISAVNAEISKHYPAKTIKPATLPDTERGRGPAGFNKSQKSLSMSDLTDEERMAWKHMGHAWKSEKEFLQAALDLRNAAKGAK